MNSIVQSLGTSLVARLAVLVAVFVVVTAVASVAGAKNLGTAATFGQVAFGLTLVALLLRSPRPPAPGDDPA